MTGAGNTKFPRQSTSYSTNLDAIINSFPVRVFNLASTSTNTHQTLRRILILRSRIAALITSKRRARLLETAREALHRLRNNSR
jgi:hypothetical protein